MCLKSRITTNNKLAIRNPIIYADVYFRCSNGFDGRRCEKRVIMDPSNKQKSADVSYSCTTSTIICNFIFLSIDMLNV